MLCGSTENRILPTQVRVNRDLYTYAQLEEWAEAEGFVLEE
jgi:hypothetical protein